jgi:RHS repeat-associated protein
VHEQDAATKAAAHANTPAIEYFDVLGRTFLTIADNASAGKYRTLVQLDIQNNERSVTDALDREIMVRDYGLLSQRLHQASMEAGERWTLNDVAGKPIRVWDSRGHNLRTEHDALRRSVRLFVLGTDPSNSDARTTAGEALFEKIDYGEGQPNDQTLNLRTRAFQHYDVAGVMKNVVTDPETGRDVAFDFKGNLLGSNRQFIRDYKALPDWSKAPPAFLPDVFISTTQYDALNRIVRARSPDGSVVRPLYNEANLLESVNVNLLGAATATTFVGNIDYDAKGQRVLIEYGDKSAPSASTTNTYDPLTFRLTNLITTRPGFPAAQPVQKLSYTYDPAGNITQIQDAAQQTIYFNNRIVEPSNDYTYDAIYRLIKASGREQLGLSGGAPSPPRPSSYNDVPRIHLPHPGDGNAMGTYIELYEYDEVGNFEVLKHSGSNPANPGWTRSYTYHEPSLLEPLKVSNRLTSTTLSGSAPLTEPYSHDLHGNMTSTPNLQSMQWDFKDQLLMTRSQAVNADDREGTIHRGERTFYTYNSTGERVRKTTESSAGARTKECFYLGALDVYREYGGGGNRTLERQTLHVMGDKRPIALVETKAGGATAIHFQFHNHLGTACLELDQTGAVISYEEYYPYGSTSYQAGRSVTEVSLKRFRYIGKERDEETGFYYLGARYYAPWLGRWTACDAAGIAESPNLYRYVSNRPLVMVDETGLAETGSSSSHWIDIPLLDELAEAVDRNLNAEARNQAASQQAQDKVNVPLVVAQEGVQTAYDLATQGPSGVVDSASTWTDEFVAAVVTPNSNQATPHAVKAVSAAMKFTVQSISLVESLRSAPQAQQSGSSAGPRSSQITGGPQKPPTPGGVSVGSGRGGATSPKPVSPPTPRGGTPKPGADTSRREAFNLAKDRAGVPRSQQAEQQGSFRPRYPDAAKGGAGTNSTENNPASQGRWYKYDTPDGKKYVIEHDVDPSQDPHFHAAQDKPGQPPVDRGGNYKQIDGKHHIFYSKGNKR